MELTYRPVPSESGTVRELELHFRRAGGTLSGLLTYQHPEAVGPAEADAKVATMLALLLSDLDRVYAGALSKQLTVKVEWR